MKYFSILIIFLYGIMATLPQNFKCMKTIEKNGMKVSWTFDDDKIKFEVFAPTRGWVAIGFNEKNQLFGTNLIMGKIENKRVNISDQYIYGLGDHRPVEEVGGINHLSGLKGTEEAAGSTIQFFISKKAMDQFHFDLRLGKDIALLLAYSTEDDFDHHSTMRTSVIITL